MTPELTQTTPIVNNFPWVIIAWAVLAIFFVRLFGGVMKKRTKAEQWAERHAPDMEGEL